MRSNSPYLEAAASSKRTNARWVVSALMFAAITINYLDRSNLAAAAPVLEKQFHLNSEEIGIVMSAFFWSYAFFQIPSGWFADRVGQRISLAIAVGWWSVMTAVTVLARGFTSLVGIRLLLGVGEAGAYPSNVGVTAKWFPDRERARVSAIFDSGHSVGSALAMPLIVWLMTQFGWQMPFIVTGIMGLFWVILWIWYYRDPERHHYINTAELHYIRDGQQNKHGLDRKRPMKWYELLRYRNIWAMCFGFFTLNYAIYFFITWFPTYLVQARGMTLMTMGFIAMIPPLTGIVAELGAGWFSDFLFARGVSLTVARKINLVGGMLLATAIAFAGLVHSAVWAVVLLSVSYAGLEFAACAVWSLPGDVAPKNMTSLVGGMQNCVSNIGGILGPIVTGFIITTTHSFIPALLISGAATLLGALTYLFGMGKIEPIAVSASQ